MDNVKSRAVNAQTNKGKGDWNYKPEDKIQCSPLFFWPPDFIAIFQWFRSFWLSISMASFELTLAVLIVIYTLPDSAQTATFEWTWVAQIWLRNLAVMIIFAGSVHLWLYGYKKQGKKFKFEHRELSQNSSLFTFKNQIHDNMFWSLVSGVSFFTAYECLVYWITAQGFPLTFELYESVSENIVTFVLLMLFIPIFSSFHFYWIHRFLHWPPLYRLAHALHHRNVNVGPWSGISMHPIEHSLYFTSVFIHVFIPSHTLHVVFHILYLTIGPVASHSGFEKLFVANKERMKLGDFFHQLHHRYYECNYGTVEMPWDRWFGTFHDGSDEQTVITRSRKKAMHNKSK